MKKVQKLKAEAGSSYNWNTLFLGHNAVADVMATNYDISKEQVCICIIVTNQKYSFCINFPRMTCRFYLAAMQQFDWRWEKRN